MSRLIILLIVVWCFQPVVYAEKPVRTEVYGNIQGFGDGKLYIHRRIPDNSKWFSDTIVIKQGKFSFQPDIPQPMMADFLFKSDDGKRRIVIELILGDNKIKISGEANKPKALKVTGDKTHQALRYLNKQFQDCIKLQDSIGNCITRIPPTQALERVRWFDEEQKLMVRWKEQLLERKDLWNNPALPYFLYSHFDKRNLVYLTEILSALPERQKKDLYCRYLQKYLELSVKSAVGTLAPDFTLYNTKGDIFRLSDYKGHYVLLDFSASWCTWCKKEIPFLREAYEAGKDKGLIVFTINMDTDRTRWESDVEKSGLPWESIGDLKGFQGDIAPAYNISGIPQIILIDPQGHIKARDLRGNALVKIMGELPRIKE